MVTLNFSGKTLNKNHTACVHVSEIPAVRRMIRESILNNREDEYVILVKFKQRFEDYIGLNGVIEK